MICYFSAGSWERGRPDSGQFPKRVRGKRLDGFPDERWLDIRQLQALAEHNLLGKDINRSGKVGDSPEEVGMKQLREQLTEMIGRGMFLEHAQVFDNRYGTTREAVQHQLAAGYDVVLDIDWQGARQVRESFPDSRTIFIVPPSILTPGKPAPTCDSSIPAPNTVTGNYVSEVSVNFSASPETIFITAQFKPSCFNL